MLLENDDIRLRALEPEDLEILYKWENDTNLWIHGNSLSPYSKLTLRQYIIDSQTQDIYQAKQLRLMIINKNKNEVVGTVDLFDLDIHNSKVGIGILIEEKDRNKGFASLSIDLIKEYVFSFLHINQMYAYISDQNKASLQLFEKSGFSKSGLLLKWIYTIDSQYQDVFIYQLINNKK